MINYLMERSNGSRYIETRTQPPEAYLAIVPSDLLVEPPDAMVVETIVDEAGIEVTRVKVDQSKAELIRVTTDAQKASVDLQRQERETRKARVKAVDWSKPKTLAELTAIIEDLVKSS